jgi:nucleotide-binding universal stress UspA family protein
MSAALRRVVIAADFSDRSLHAARWAVRHVTRDAEITLVHVVTIPELPRFIRARVPQIASITESAVAGAARRLEQVAASLRVPRVGTDVRVGNAAEQIADAARAADADLIVVGRHGDRPGLLHRIGTTADRLVRIATAPVLLATSMRDTSPRHLLAALDDADITPRVVEWTRYLTARFKADVTGLHVVTSGILTQIESGGFDRGVTRSPSAIQAAVARDGVEWVRSVLGHEASEGSVPPADAEVAFGWVAHEIVRAAERRNSELIVVGRTGSGLGGRMLMGSVTRQVLHNALCPVLVVIEARTMSAPQAPAA